MDDGQRVKISQSELKKMTATSAWSNTKIKKLEREDSANQDADANLATAPDEESGLVRSARQA